MTKIQISDERFLKVVHEHIGFGRIYFDNFDPKKMRLGEEKVLEKCCNYSKGQDKRGWLMCGGVGVGKTATMCHMAFLLLRSKVMSPGTKLWRMADPEKVPDYEPYMYEWLFDIPTFRYIRTSGLFNLFFERRLDRIEELQSCSILFLDDLGVEYSTEYPLSKFEDFIEYRYSEKLPTFITTNIHPKELRKHLDWARIVDRILDPRWMQVVTIAGESMRKKE